MDRPNVLPEIIPVLQHYAIRPHFAEDYGKVKKVYTQSGNYALKKIDPRHGVDFIRHLQYLYHKGYSRIVPIFPAQDGRYAIYENEGLYYLMPWLSNDEKESREEKPFRLFRELARLHSVSSKEVEISQEAREFHYENTIEKWEKDEEFLEGFIEVCEEQVYLSPFQLIFSLYYHNIRQAMEFAKGKLQEWHEKTKEQKKSRMVLLHGKVSPDHFLYDEKGYGYFANFEAARYGSPMQDLLPFLSRYLNTLPKRSDECVDWISNYLGYFPLKEEERLLFLSYLAYPSSVLRTVVNYHMPKNRLDERKQVQKLQRNFWHLKNTEYVAMRLEEIERQKAQAKAAAQQEKAQS